MQIDWFTTGAQIVNFLILVWLLQRFLYRPVTRAMDRRARRIADRLREAEASKAAAANEVRRFEEKRAELEEGRAQLLTEARNDAEKQKKALHKSARQEVDRQKQAWLAQLASERETFLREFRRQSTAKFYSMAKHVLQDIANADLETEIVKAFLDRLERTNSAILAQLAAICSETGGTILVRSGFDMAPSLKRKMTGALRRLISADARITYRTSDDIACGVELKIGSRRLAWDLDNYLDGLEGEIAVSMAGLTAQHSQQSQK